MCECCCQQPQKLKGKPEECTAEQIRECHGEVKDHPCEGEKKEPEHCRDGAEGAFRSGAR